MGGIIKPTQSPKGTGQDWSENQFRDPWSGILSLLIHAAPMLNLGWILMDATDHDPFGALRNRTT